MLQHWRNTINVYVCIIVYKKLLPAVQSDYWIIFLYFLINDDIFLPPGDPVKLMVVGFSVWKYHDTQKEHKKQLANVVHVARTYMCVLI